MASTTEITNTNEDVDSNHIIEDDSSNVVVDDNVNDIGYIQTATHNYVSRNAIV